MLNVPFRGQRMTFLNLRNAVVLVRECNWTRVENCSNGLLFDLELVFLSIADSFPLYEPSSMTCPLLESMLR
jgi:hypothetical protein